jgi:hypothetical protein
MKVYKRLDGYAYWLRGGKLWACPHLVSGELDKGNTMLVSEFIDPLNDCEIDDIKYILEFKNRARDI